MATELFSIWGFQTGWRSQWGDGYEVTATLDGVHICYWAHNSETVEKMFEHACRRTLFRRFVPWLSPPPIELGDRLREPEPMTYQAEILRAGGTVSTIETLHRAMLDARVHGQESSNYFLDKCESEAGGPATSVTVGKLAGLLAKMDQDAVVVLRYDYKDPDGSTTCTGLASGQVHAVDVRALKSKDSWSDPLAGAQLYRLCEKGDDDLPDAEAGVLIG